MFMLRCLRPGEGTIKQMEALAKTPSIWTQGLLAYSQAGEGRECLNATKGHTTENMWKVPRACWRGHLHAARDLNQSQQRGTHLARVRSWLGVASPAPEGHTS